MLVNTDLKCILKFLQELMVPCNLENFPAHVVAALPHLIPSELTCWTPTDFSRRKLLKATTSSDPVADLYLEVGNQHFEEHPFGTYYFQTGDRKAHTLTDFLSEAQLQRLEGLYQKTLRVLGLEEQMATILPSTPVISSDSAGLRQQKEDIVVSLHRLKRDFTERDRLILNLMRPHLMQAYQNAQTLTQIQQELEQLNQTLEQTRTVILTRDLKVQRMTYTASELLRQYFQVSSHSVTHLPENLLRWVKRQIHQMNAADHISSPCLPLQLEREGKRLSVRLIPDLPNEQYLLFLQEELPPSFSPELLMMLGLTKREAEVLFWAAKDKSNREIALILGCSDKTVQKHLEHIYGKLGVQTRGAAIVCALKQLGILNY